MVNVTLPPLSITTVPGTIVSFEWRDWSWSADGGKPDPTSTRPNRTVASFGLMTAPNVRAAGRRSVAAVGSVAEQEPTSAPVAARVMMPVTERVTRSRRARGERNMVPSFPRGGVWNDWSNIQSALGAPRVAPHCEGDDPSVLTLWPASQAPSSGCLESLLEQRAHACGMA